MKQEKLFRALSDVGDDLLMMAQNRRFANPWKRWGTLAACIALVLCLGMVALPYFPVGCGSSMAPAEMAPAETPAETPAEAPAVTEEASVEETPALDAEAQEEAKGESGLQEVITVWFEDEAYEVGSTCEFPADLGEELGVVQASDGRDLTGNRVFAALDLGGIYVEIEEGIYLYAEPTAMAVELL